MAKPKPTPENSLAKHAYLIWVLPPNALPQWYSAGADNFLHALALVGDYCNNPNTKIEFVRELGAEDIEHLQLKRGQVVSFA
jgi:hypothetical protein